MTDVLDAGALTAADRGDRAMWTRLKAAPAADEPLTHGGIVGQAWRGGPKQARLARFLAGVDVRPLTDELGRACGVLLGATATTDVVDAALVLLAADGDVIYTSDPEDIARLAARAGSARRRRPGLRENLVSGRDSVRNDDPVDVVESAGVDA